MTVKNVDLKMCVAHIPFAFNNVQNIVIKQVGVKIYLSSSGLTKVVTFTPYYLLLNISTVWMFFVWF